MLKSLALLLGCKCLMKVVGNNLVEQSWWSNKMHAMRSLPCYLLVFVLCSTSTMWGAGALPLWAMRILRSQPR